MGFIDRVIFDWPEKILRDRQADRQTDRHGEDMYAFNSNIIDLLRIDTSGLPPYYKKAIYLVLSKVN